MYFEHELEFPKKFLEGLFQMTTYHDSKALFLFLGVYLQFQEASTHHFNFPYVQLDPQTYSPFQSS